MLEILFHSSVIYAECKIYLKKHSLCLWEWTSSFAIAYAVLEPLLREMNDIENGLNLFVRLGVRLGVNLINTQLFE